MGSRYGGIKQIDGFGPGGETIMDYSLYDAIRAGFSKIVFIVRDEIEETVKEMFLPKLQGKAEVHFVVQTSDKFVPAQFQPVNRKKPWGTTHAMLCGMEVIDGPFAVINADDFYGRSMPMIFMAGKHLNRWLRFFVQLRKIIMPWLVIP